MLDYILTVAIFKFKMAAGYHVDSDILIYIYKTKSVPILVLLSQNAQSDEKVILSRCTNLTVACIILCPDCCLAVCCLQLVSDCCLAVCCLQLVSDSCFAVSCLQLVSDCCLAVPCLQ